MSNSRIFAFGWFVTIGVLCALGNRGVRFGTNINVGWDEPSAFVVLATTIAFCLVAVFGDRRSA